MIFSTDSLDRLVSKPVLSSTLWLLLTICLGSGLLELRVTPDNRIFYSEENERFADLLAFEDKYLPNNNILFVIYRASGTPIETTDAIRWVEERAWQIRQTLRVDSIASYPIVAENSEDSVDISPLLDSLCESTEPCHLVAGWSSPYPEIVGRFVSKDETAIATILTIDVELGTVGEISAISKEARELMDEFRQRFPHLEIAHTGGVPMMQAFADASEADSALLLPAALILILLSIVVLLRSVRIALLLIATGLLSAISTMGLAGHLGMTINTATSLTSVIVLTVVVASNMHLVVSYLNELRLYDSYRSAKNAVSVNLQPILLTTLTSMLGFLSLRLADAPPLGELGFLAAFGIFLGGLKALTLVPALLASMDLGEYKGVRTARLAAALANESKAGTKAAVLFTFLAISIAGLSVLRVNDDFVSYFDSRYPFRIETDLIESLISSPNHIEIDVGSTVQDGIFNPEYISALNAFQAQIQNDPLVANTYGYVDILKKARVISETEDRRESSEELAQLFLIYEMSLSYGQSTDDFVSTDKQSSRISILLRRSNSVQINELKSKIEILARNDYPTLRVIVTGENVPVANLTEQNFQSMSTGIGISIAVAAILLTFMYKSLLLGCIVFLAVAIPILTTFGLWGWVSQDIGLASVVIISVALGIVVDDAIHFISRFQAFRRDGRRSTNEASALTVRVVGSAIIVTSIALICGFGAICLSGFEINFAMGVCMVTVVSVSLLVDLIGVPIALRKFAGAITDNT
ncbi:MAG: efflux RND transporter permease subunit [Pseudomonadales bacterium]